MVQNSRGTMLSILLLIAAFGCRDDIPLLANPIVTPFPAGTNIGPAGGTLDLAGGAVRLQIGPGVLAKAVYIEAVPVSNSPSGSLVVPGTVYELRPTDLRFTAYVTLTLRYSPAAIPDVAVPSELRIFGSALTTWQQIAGSRELNGAVVASVTELGVYGVVAPPVASVSVSPQNVQLASENDIVQLTAVARDADGNALVRRRVTWTTSDSMSAKVTSTGLVVATRGSAAVTAASEGQTSTVAVQVLPGAAIPILLEDFSTYSSTTDLASNPRGIFPPSEDIAVPKVRTGSISSQAIVASNSYTVIGTGTRFTTEAIPYGIVSTGDVKIQITTLINDTLFIGKAITTGTLTGAYTHPNFSNFVSPVAFGELVLDKSVGYGTSGQSMRYDQYDRTLQGSPGRCSDFTISRTIAIPSNGGNGEKEVWVEFVIKFSAGWDYVAPSDWGCTSGPEYKTLLFGVSALTVGGKVNQDGRFSESIHADWEANWPTGSSGSMAVNDPGPPSTASIISDPSWHVLRVNARVSSVADFPDGRLRFWVDGVLVANHTGLVINRSGINTIRLGANMNQGPGALQSLWWSRIRVLTTDPSW